MLLLAIEWAGIPGSDGGQTARSAVSLHFVRCSTDGGRSCAAASFRRNSSFFDVESGQSAIHAAVKMPCPVTALVFMPDR